tara:strand:+ start:2700 stop:3584 length:885 start_codon:yes stop_codon:yes gene_type:complete
MRISIITPTSQNIEPLISVFESKGVTVDKNKLHPECDAIIGTGQVGVHLVELFHKTLPEIPLINLTLDFYKTVWTAPNPHGYNWQLYKDVLIEADELWCLSNEVILRMKEEGININKCRMMKIWARFFEYAGEVKDGRYILNPVRPYLYDKNHGWLEQACEELEIPLVRPNHRLSEEEFKRNIAECSFMCCEYHEASTGGLTLLEGLRLGKVSVVSDSPYCGARDYLGEHAIYFNDNSYEDFKQVIKNTWENTPTIDKKEREEFCAAHPSMDDMATRMINRLTILTKGKNCNES